MPRCFWCNRIFKKTTVDHVLSNFIRNVYIDWAIPWWLTHEFDRLHTVDSCWYCNQNRGKISDAFEKIFVWRTESKYRYWENSSASKIPCGNTKWLPWQECKDVFDGMIKSIPSTLIDVNLNLLFDSARKLDFFYKKIVQFEIKCVKLFIGNDTISKVAVKNGYIDIRMFDGKTVSLLVNEIHELKGIKYQDMLDFRITKCRKYVWWPRINLKVNPGRRRAGNDRNEETH